MWIFYILIGNSIGNVIEPYIFVRVHMVNKRHQQTQTTAELTG